MDHPICKEFFKESIELKCFIWLFSSYSTDDGETWKRYKFTETPIRIHGLLNEPGETTTILFLFGSNVSHHSWKTISLNMSNVFRKYHFACEITNIRKPAGKRESPKIMLYLDKNRFHCLLVDLVWLTECANVSWFIEPVWNFQCLNQNQMETTKKFPYSVSSFYLSPVKRICVFEHSVMTNFNCACPAIQRGQGSGFLSQGPSWLTACMSEQRRFWRDCADARARLNLRCSHRR